MKHQVTAFFLSFFSFLSCLSPFLFFFFLFSYLEEKKFEILLSASKYRQLLFKLSKFKTAAKHQVTSFFLSFSRLFFLLFLLSLFLFLNYSPKKFEILLSTSRYRLLLFGKVSTFKLSQALFVAKGSVCVLSRAVRATVNTATSSSTLQCPCPLLCPSVPLSVART